MQAVARRSAPWRVLVGALALVAAGCGGGPSPGPGHAHGPGGGHPGADDGADTYHAGLEREGEEGRVRVRLVDSDPVPQDTGLYTWTLTVEDLEGEPVVGASVSAEPTMPAHGHGTFPAITEATPLEEVGHFRLADMDLFMAGVWDVALTVSLVDGGADTLTFHFRLEG